ncbi:MAG: prolyl oligopeptidase family serine peptidase [Bacteroidia bacterium]
MNKNFYYYFLFIFFIINILNSCKTESTVKEIALNYPKTKKVDQVDDYFGTPVEDPYRWLEDDNSEETAEWVKQQNDVTFSYLSKIPFREKIKERLSEIWDFPKYGIPFKKGNFYFMYKNDGVQNQSVLYILNNLNDEPKVLIDPNKFSIDGTSALTNFDVSNNGKYAAFSVSKAGSDWKEYYVMELPSGKILRDTLKWIKFSNAAWLGDGFFYTRYDEPNKERAFSGKNEFAKVYYHRIGTPQSEDFLVYSDDKNPLNSFYAGTTEDESFVYMSESVSTSGNALYIKKSNDKNFIKIADGFEYDYDVIDNNNDILLVFTNDNAPKGRLIAIDTKNPQRKNWKDILPEKNDVLESVTICNNLLVAKYMKDVQSRLEVYDLDGNFKHEIKLPGVGIVGGFNAKRNEPIAFFSFSTFTAPTSIYKYDIDKNEVSLYKKPEIKFNSDDYETKQIFYTSKDGTKVPMFITYKKGIKLDGNNPTLLYGYGGFNISVTPSFSVSRAVFMEQGGIYAVANIRGGGEYGKEWHKAGTQLQKQNVFDDFIAAAEYLINEKYTSPEKLAIEGRSNGGLLVGAVMTQRPDLFKVALPGVGVLDMLRYHKFTIGYAWATDYGTSDEEIHFKNLIKYSPLHNIKEGINYPATLITTGDHDDRVVPAHSFKFAATLQEKHKGTNPVLIRIDVNAGHGAGKPTSKQIEESADVLSFMMYNLGMNFNY